MSQAFKLKTTPENVAFLVFDEEGCSMNRLSTVTLLQLQTYLQELKNDETLKGLIIISGKKSSFIAGANIDHIQHLKNTQEMIEFISLGQTLFNLLSSFNYPTAAAIHGVCLGGGLELALACDYRVATLDNSTRLGLPEVKLGLVPAWGGCKRLPQIIDYTEAVKLITTGRTVSSEKAYEIGLIDTLCSNSNLYKHAEDFILTGLKSRRKRSKNKFLKKLVTYKAKKIILKKTKTHYPAPLAALKLLSQGATDQTEQESIIELIQGSVSHNLIKVFLSQDKVKKNKGGSAPPKIIEYPAVIGAGVMGGSLAFLLANARYPVVLKDVEWDKITKSYKECLRYSKNNQVFHHITPTLSYQQLKSSDFVIEAAAESLEVKRKIYKELEECLSKEAVICTNTSSFSVTELSAELRHPERFIGVHFFNPVSRMPLVEIIPGEHTSQETTTTAIAFVKTLKKIPILFKDCPGFVVNRILMSGMLKALSLLESGFSVEKIDQALENFGFPMGPCRLLDEIGLDLALQVGMNLNKAYGDRMKVPALLKKMVEEGALGKKIGTGFYLHTKKVNPLLKKIIKPSPYKESQKEIVELIITVMYQEAKECLKEKISSSPQEIDLALILGTGFPPFRGGLISYQEDCHDT